MNCCFNKYRETPFYRRKPYSNPGLDSTVGVPVPSFAATNLNGTNLPVPNVPTHPPRMHHKSFPHAVRDAATNTATTTSPHVPAKSSSSLNRSPDLYLTEWERVTSTRSHFLHSPLNSAETDPVSLDPPISPRHIVHNTNSRTKSYMSPNPPGFQPRSEFINPVLIGSSYRGSGYTSHNIPSQRQLQLESDPVTPPVDSLYAQIKEHAPFMVGLVSLPNLSFLRCATYHTNPSLASWGELPLMPFVRTR